MQDWKASSLASGRKKKLTEKNPAESFRTEIKDPNLMPAIDSRAPSGDPDSVQRTWQPGMILSINKHTLGVYKKFMPESAIHLVAILCSDGFIKIQGISFKGMEVDEIGNLTPELFKHLESLSKWERDLIVFHCYRYEDTFRIPIPSVSGKPSPKKIQPNELNHFGAVSESDKDNDISNNEVMKSDAGTNQAVDHEPAAPEEIMHLTSQNPIAGMQRGQRVQIQMGMKLWNAVFWGCDMTGMVVAHNTCKKWSLMYLDLHRYRNSLKIDPQIDQGLIQEIQDDLS